MHGDTLIRTDTGQKIQVTLHPFSKGEELHELFKIMKFSLKTSILPKKHYRDSVQKYKARYN